MRADAVVAIHQPNFFPWLGYFDKIARADVFVILDDAQLPKKGGSWVNRVNVRIDDSAQFLTMPVRRPAHGVAPIHDVAPDDTRPWRDELGKKLTHAYARAPHFDAVFPVVDELLAHQAPNIAAFNTHAIRALCDRVGLDPAKLVSSAAFELRETATDRLIALVHRVGGSTYLCGGGATGYQEDDKFGAAGIALRYQEFQHPRYAQHAGETFVPGLSILDALFNLGFAGVRPLLGAS